ncbi:hypothetical protein K1719_037242 [Acacia pycnantha]|nr:hypothetical protein K1719_037242 [Acacia pycnantha]
MEIVTVGERDLVCLELFPPIMNRIRMFFNSKSGFRGEARNVKFCGENLDFLIQRAADFVAQLLLLYSRSSWVLHVFPIRRMRTCGRDIPLETQFLLIEGKIDETLGWSCP